MKFSSRWSALAAVSLSALFATEAAHAGAFGIREQSATAQGLSFAGAASGSGGLSSIFWNPATITMRPGWQSEWHASLILPEARVTPVEGTSPFLLPLGPSGDIGQGAIIPASYTGYQVNDRLWLGLATSAPFGLVTDPRTNWAGQIYSRSSQVFSLNLNPIAGLRVNEWLSIGAGPVVQYFDVRLKRAVGIAPNAPSLILDGDDVGFGFTAGLTLTPFAGTAIGLGFRSAIHHELDGSVRIPAFRSESTIQASLNTPEQLTVGISQALTPQMTVHAGFEWTNWSRLKQPAIIGPVGTIDLLRLNYDDGFLYSVGLDYRLSDRLALRGGLAYEQSPVNTEIRGTRLPDNDRVWASIGASYQWSEKLTFDIGYSHLFIDEADVRIVPGHQDYIAGLPFVAEAEATIDIVSVALKYHWDAPARPAPVVPAAPIVRKY